MIRLQSTLVPLELGRLRSNHGRKQCCITVQQEVLTIVNMMLDPVTTPTKSFSGMAPASSSGFPFSKVRFEHLNAGELMDLRCFARFKAIPRPIDPRPY